MGVCCSRRLCSRLVDGHVNEEEEKKEVEGVDIIRKRNAGARILLRGSSKYVSMFTKQGKKGINQDAMTVWESFSGDKDMFFCAVFDGHGPSGHKVARYIRDLLPAKLYLLYKQSSTDGKNAVPGTETRPDDADQNPEIQDPLFLSWKARLTKGFAEIDEQLEGEKSIESYSSGSTTVSVLKKDEHLVIANLGDSRAVLCKRDENGRFVSEQLTVDLKPNVPSEENRIRRCKGRVMAMHEDSNVYRVWKPNEDLPGLAMARAFGDFCLKDFGLISTPQVTYRKLTEKDEFVVLATDGVWDALSNNKVVKIVASARNRSTAAKLLVEKAVREWRFKYPFARTDDCAVVCLFFNRQESWLTESYSEVSQLSRNYTHLKAQRSAGITHDALDVKMTESLQGPENGDDLLSSSSGRLRKRKPWRKLEYAGD